MNNSRSLLDGAWSSAVGGLEWLKSVLLGEFDDHRPLSALITDMLLSFVPGVVIVTGARDAVAVIVRLAQHPEKREDPLEWMVLSACMITLALPLALAAGGLAAAGAGAVVGGIAGSELGAALRAVMLLLIKESAKLADVLRFLQKFMMGDLIAFLRAIKFAKYEKSLLMTFDKTVKKLIEICSGLRAQLGHLQYINDVKLAIEVLAEWERKFYAVQTAALKKLPIALAEFDVRLSKLLTQLVPKDEHLVAAGVRSPNAPLQGLKPQFVNDAAGVPLFHAEALAESSGTLPKVLGKVEPVAKRTSRAGENARRAAKNRPDKVHQAVEGRNAKRQETLDLDRQVGKRERRLPEKSPSDLDDAIRAKVLADRIKISTLSQQAAEAENAARAARAADNAVDAEAHAAVYADKIREARAVLRRYVDSGDVNAVLQRLDVSSPKRGAFFWSGEGALEAAADFARGADGVSLETTLGGRIANNWDAINDSPIKDFSRDLWGGLSKNYADGVEGTIRIVQSDQRFAEGGGYVWKNIELKAIVDQARVPEAVFLDLNGKIREVASFDDLVKLNEKFQLQLLGPR